LDGKKKRNGEKEGEREGGDRDEGKGWRNEEHSRKEV
jgi:hypothetical protein